jgi:hypothetical protein
MQYKPDAVLLVQADFQEMVACPNVPRWFAVFALASFACLTMIASNPSCRPDHAF